jgi:hypothetical protein
VACREQARRAVLELDPRPQPRERGARRWRADERGVLPLVAVAGMEDAVGPLAVVGEDHQALRLHVQAPGRPEPLAPGVDERHDGSATPLVACRAEEAPRLVDGEVDRGWGGPERLSVHLDPVVRRIRGLAECGEPAIDSHAAVGDELLGTAARRQASARDELLEPLTGHRRCWPARRAVRRRWTAAAAHRLRSAQSARGM